MTLYNEIKQHFHIPNAFTDWEPYRNTLTDYLICQTDTLDVPLHFTCGMTENKIQPSLLVIGAGTCNDLDVAKLIPHFSNITLLDSDRTSLESAIANYHLEHADTVTLLTESLNGLNDRDYHTFCEHLSDFLRHKQLSGSPVSPETFETYACSLLKESLSGCARHNIPLPEKSYDFIWCFGVHSQLLSMFSYIYQVFKLNLQKMYLDFADTTPTVFENILKEENNRFIPILHDAILQCARQKVFIGLEANRKLPADTGLSFDSTPIEGAYQGIMDLQSRKLNLRESSIFWPFCPDDNLYYQMQIEEITLS